MHATGPGGADETEEDPLDYNETTPRGKFNASMRAKAAQLLGLQSAPQPAVQPAPGNNPGTDATAGQAADTTDRAAALRESLREKTIQALKAAYGTASKPEGQ